MVALASTLSSTAAVATSTPAADAPLLEHVHVKIGGELFARARAARLDGQSFEKSYAITRARLSVTLRYADFLRLTLEPDFASTLCEGNGATCSDAEVADAFIEVSPLDEFDVRAGQAKTPYSAFQTISVWRLPAQRRGLIADLVTNRLGFGDRKLGIKVRAREKDLLFKPTLELGGYTVPERGFDEDFAARVTLRPWKGGEVALQAYAERKATTARKTAPAFALSIMHDRDAVFAMAELQIGHAPLLTLEGGADVDSTFIAFAILTAYRVLLEEEHHLALEPYAGLDVFDPNAKTTDDTGYEVRGGINVRMFDMLRIGVEAARRSGARTFPEPPSTTISVQIGASLE